MEQINKVEILGRIGTVRTQAFSDAKVVNFSVAVETAYKNRNGEAVVETTWFDCVYWDRNEGKADTIEKGAFVHAKGRLRKRKYTGSDGSERYATEVLVAWLDVKTETPANDDLPEDLL